MGQPPGAYNSPKAVSPPSTLVPVILVILFILGFLAAPVTLAWGWLRWLMSAKSSAAPSILSFIGFLFATVSGLLAVSTIAYIFLVRRFPYYDPTLLRIYRWGFLLSLGGIVFGISGMWRQSSLRWHAPVSGLTTLAFWIVAAAGE